MSSLYIIESDNHKAISKTIEKILQDKKFPINELLRYDLEETNIVDVINDLDTYGLFQEKKIIYASNATFLGTGKSEIDHNIDAFTKYINNPNENNVLIISCSKLDGKKSICKLIKSKFEFINPVIDYKEYIKEKTNGYKISLSDINYLISVTGDNLDRLDNELDKLLFFTIDTKKITKDDIDLIVIKKIDDNIFNLIDAIISKDKKTSLTIYNEMVNYGTEVFKLFISLANQIRLIYQVKVLSNLPNEEIVDLLGIKNPKQVSALRYKINKYREQDLRDYLYKLALIDEQIKLGTAIDKIVFPIFIASL